MNAEVVRKDLAPSAVKDFLSGGFVPLWSEATLHMVPNTAPTRMNRGVEQYEGVVRALGMGTAVQVTLRQGFFNRTLSKLGINLLPTPVVIEPVDTLEPFGDIG